MKHRTNMTDMTVGTPGRLLLRFTIPLLLSVIFQQLYNLADSVVVGQFVGEDALAAVGASYPVTMIFLAFATGTNIGCSVIISQLFGAKDYRTMKSAISTSLLTGVGLSLTLTLLGTVFTTGLLTLLNTPGNIFADSRLYLQIYTAGLLFLFSYNVVNGIFTALGDSKTPLYFLIASSLGNIGMDILFVAAFRMGVAGVAWATFLCQGVAAVLAVITLLVRIRRVGERDRFRPFSLRLLGRLARVAVPSILQQSFVSVGNLLVQGLINSFGSAVVAGYSAAAKYNVFAITCFNTLGNGVSSFTAQNVGARRLERIPRGFAAALRIAACVAVVFSAVYFFFGRALMTVFMDPAKASEEAFGAGIAFLRIVSPFFIVLVTKLSADGVMRGAGAMVYFMISTFLDLVLRVVLAYVLSPVMGTAGIWSSWPPSWIIGAGLSIFFYLRGVWKKKLPPLPQAEP